MEKQFNTGVVRAIICFHTLEGGGVLKSWSQLILKSFPTAKVGFLYPWFEMKLFYMVIGDWVLSCIKEYIPPPVLDDDLYSRNGHSPCMILKCKLTCSTVSTRTDICTSFQIPPTSFNWNKYMIIICQHKIMVQWLSALFCGIFFFLCQVTFHKWPLLDRV